MQMATFSKRLLLFASLTVLTLISVVNAQTIKGKVLDATTGEPLVGAIVKLENTKFKTIVKLDGTYSFAKLPLGTYTLKVNYEGFVNADVQTITLTDNSIKTVGFNLKPAVSELSTVTVSTLSEKNGEVGARRLEKTSDPIINVLSAKTLQLLPDITVANALQRVSGVSIQRGGSGEGRYPIIRGMEKRYINTLVNGIKIPSPDNKSRFIPLDLFPSDLLERLEVSKSLTPSMEGDAIGGTINLVMKDAPTKRLLNVNASLGYSDYFMNNQYMDFNKGSINKQSPTEIKGTASPTDFSVAALHSNNISRPINNTLGITYGDRFGKTKQFGLIMAGSYQNIFKGLSSTYFQPGAPVFNQPTYKQIEDRKYSYQSNRKGLTAKLDYVVDSKNKLILNTNLVSLDDYSYRLDNFYTPVNRQSIDYLNRATWQYQSIINTSLLGLHDLGKGYNLDWSLVYSLAQNHRPDQVESDHQVNTIDKTDKVQSISHAWIHNTDQDYTEYLNLTKKVTIAGKSLELKAGEMVRIKHRNNLYHHYSLTPLVPGELFISIDSSKYTFKGVGSSDPNNNNGNNYDFDENVDAGYIQGRLGISPKLELLGGVRVEYTHQHYKTGLDSAFPSISGTIKYTDILPSLQLKYRLDNEKALRFAYYKALARPGFAEMIPDGIGVYDEIKEVGNPDSLNHSLADNIDLRYEYFSGKAEQLLIGAFYKNIQDPIEYSTETVNATAVQYKPKNFGSATNYGFEVLATKYWGNIGLSGSYTFTESSVTTNKLHGVKNSVGSVNYFPINQTRPLQGQSKHIGNVSVLYKNPRIGLDLQASLVYTGERLAIVNPYYNLDYWQTPTTQVDLSLEKRLNKNFYFYAKVNNIANAPYKLFLKQPYDATADTGHDLLSIQSSPSNKTFVQADYYKATYLFGVRYKL